MGAAVGGPDGVKELANYVLSLSGSTHDAKLAEAGKAKFTVCAACHGPEGTGDRAQGAPNLADAIWLYGGDRATLTETVALSEKLGKTGEAVYQESGIGPSGFIPVPATTPTAK